MSDHRAGNMVLIAPFGQGRHNGGQQKSPCCGGGYDIIYSFLNSIIQALLIIRQGLFFMPFLRGKRCFVVVLVVPIRVVFLLSLGIVP